MDYLGKKQNELLKKYNIVLEDNLSHRIPTGWIPLLERVFQKMIDAGWDRQILQIKEKLGSLRIYVDQNSDAIHKIVWDAEEESRSICDICSSPGKITNNKGILAARCEAHENVGDDYLKLDEDNFVDYDKDVRRRIARRKLNGTD